MNGGMAQNGRCRGDDPEAVIVDVTNGEGINQSLGANFRFLLFNL